MTGRNVAIAAASNVTFAVVRNMRSILSKVIRIYRIALASSLVTTMPALALITVGAAIF